MLSFDSKFFLSLKKAASLISAPVIHDVQNNLNVFLEMRMT